MKMGTCTENGCSIRQPTIRHYHDLDESARHAVSTTVGGTTVITVISNLQREKLDLTITASLYVDPRHERLS